MFEISPTPLDGLLTVTPLQRPDPRGRFVKLFHAPSFAAAGLCTDYREQYLTTSHRNVLRGMHFQTPPHDHAKLVYCLSGRVLDVALDLRRGSATFGLAFSAELDGDADQGLYIPRGFAHGFLTLSAEAALHYFVETAHAPDHDTGVRWDSFGFDWPIQAPLISPRDAALPPWERRESPF
jgi:dTDP-4-dehydrorhamnose 3,5-epimerase